MPTRRSFLISSAALPLAANAIAQTSASSLPPSIAALRNRAHEAVPITVAERQHRIDRARELMAQQKISAIAMTGGTSLVYFTGIKSGVSERMFAWVLPASGAPFIVCPMFEEARMTEQLNEMPEGKQTKIYTWNEDEDPYALLVKHLPNPGPLALDERLPFVYADRLAQADPSRKVVSGIPITAGCRMIKSPAELALMQLANNITLSVYKAAWQAGAPGMTTAQFTALISAGFARCGTSGAASCQTGEWSALPHGSITPQVIKENSIVLIDDGCSIEGYSSDISRTFVYGKATDRQKKVFDVVHEAQAKALAAASPDRPATQSTTQPAKSSRTRASARTTRHSRTDSDTESGWTDTSGRIWCAGTPSPLRWGCAFRMSRESISKASLAFDWKTIGTLLQMAA